jgi:hypothetical protein
MTLLQARTTKLSLSRFAQASTAALITLVLVGAARADTIKDFVVSGTARNVTGRSLGSCAAGSTCSFAGTMMVDLTSSAAFPDGTVAAYDITFPGLAAFNNCCFDQAGSISFVWIADSFNNARRVLFLNIHTTHIPASLVGFEGGSIAGAVRANPLGHGLYSDLKGSTTPVPEPSSLALLGGGVLVFVQGLRRKLM